MFRVLTSQPDRNWIRELCVGSGDIHHTCANLLSLCETHSTAVHTTVCVKIFTKVTEYWEMCLNHHEQNCDRPFKLSPCTSQTLKTPDDELLALTPPPTHQSSDSTLICACIITLSAPREMTSHTGETRAEMSIIRWSCLRSDAGAQTGPPHLHCMRHLDDQREVNS